MTNALDLVLTDGEEEPDPFLQAAARAVLESTEWLTHSAGAGDTVQTGAR